MGQSKKTPIFMWLLALVVVALCLWFAYDTGRSKTAGTKAGQTKAASRQTQPPQVNLAKKLVPSWKAIIAGRQDSVDIAVYDHATGQTVHYGNIPVATTFNTASIMKLSLLENLLLQDQKQGTGLTDDQLAYVQPMIENSDNDAATALWTQEGGTDALNSFFHELGTTSTTAGSQEYWGLTQTTALDQLKVLNAVAYPGKYLTAASAQAADNLMDHVESDQHWGVSAGVPAGVSVQLKNGWLQGADADGRTWDINSIGHVHGGGVDYTIAVLTNGNETEQYGIDTIQSLSTATYNYLVSLKKS